MEKKQPSSVVPQYNRPDDFSSKHLKNLLPSYDPENKANQCEGPDK